MIDFDAMRVAKGWPTPNHVRQCADALDILTPARYGEILRWFADRCDERVWSVVAPDSKERLAVFTDEIDAAAEVKFTQPINPDPATAMADYIRNLKGEDE